MNMADGSVWSLFPVQTPGACLSWAESQETPARILKSVKKTNRTAICYGLCSISCSRIIIDSWSFLGYVLTQPFVVVSLAYIPFRKKKSFTFH
jgi:hypothetical protein